MCLTKNSLGILTHRYKTVLKKCFIASLVGGMIAMTGLVFAPQASLAAVNGFTQDIGNQYNYYITPPNQLGTINTDNPTIKFYGGYNTDIIETGGSGFRVNMTGGEASRIVGAYANQDNSLDISNNIVNISGGTVEGYVMGGSSYGDYAENNIVNISGGTVICITS